MRHKRNLYFNKGILFLTGRFRTANMAGTVLYAMGKNMEEMIMKRCMKGGFLVLSGVIGIVGVIIAAMQNPSTEWVAPPGRMITSILENGIVVPAVLFLALFVWGLYILLTEDKNP